MPVWKYNDKCYLKVNDKRVIAYRVGLSNEIPDGKNE